MPKIVGSVEINASMDRVWEVISDLDNEAEYWWGTKEVRNISKDGNVLSREITQNFRNHKILQKVIITPKNEIETRYLKGLTEGVRFLKQENIGENKQKVTATWDVRFPGIYILLSYFIARHIRKGTSDALARIKQASEGTRTTSGS
ncbi:MAG TPA: SRPBCC family protein [Nitrososphaerales archaeon]|nr:SRPBCC family protein [Nitrososphaerales archaeon]